MRLWRLWYEREHACVWMQWELSRRVRRSAGADNKEHCLQATPPGTPIPAVKPRSMVFYVRNIRLVFWEVHKLSVETSPPNTSRVAKVTQIDRRENKNMLQTKEKQWPRIYQTEGSMTLRQNTHNSCCWLPNCIKNSHTLAGWLQ